MRFTDRGRSNGRSLPGRGRVRNSRSANSPFRAAERARRRRIDRNNATFGALVAAFHSTGYLGLPMLVAPPDAADARPAIEPTLVDLILAGFVLRPVRARRHVRTLAVGQHGCETAERARTRRARVVGAGRRTRCRYLPPAQTRRSSAFASTRSC
jgi:hypothetical protein